MFDDYEKNSYQPENISKKSCDLEDPHGIVVYSLKIRVLSF